MFNSLKKLFNKPAPEQERPPLDDTTRPDEPLEALYAEFCRTFCVEPGVPLMSRIQADEDHFLRDWLRWDTDRPEPKALIRLGVSAFRGGLQVWDGQPLDMYIEGEREDDGGPSEESITGLSWFCKETGSPITIYWESLADGQMKVTKITPS